jgi:hypothetical protein
VNAAAPQDERDLVITPQGLYALTAVRLRSLAGRLATKGPILTVYEVSRLLVDVEALALDAGTLEDADLAQLAADLGAALSGAVALSPMLLARLSGRCWAAETACQARAEGGAS